MRPVADRVRGAPPRAQTAALREARVKYWSFRRTESPQLQGSRLEVSAESDIRIFSYECLTDTVDPHGPKGK